MNVLSTLPSPIVVLWVGALVFYVVDRFLAPQDRGLAEVIVILIAIVFLLGMHPSINVHPAADAPGINDDRANVSMLWTVDTRSWWVGLFLLCCLLAALLLSLEGAAVTRVGRLATLGAALLFVFAGNWRTLAFAWVLVDLGLLYTVGKGRKRTDSLIRSGMLSLAGAAILGISVSLWQQADGGLWASGSAAWPYRVVGGPELPAKVAGLLTGAAVLRLLPFPLPEWQLIVDEDGQDPLPVVQMTVFVVPMLLAATLWARLAQESVLAQSGRWLTVLGVWACIGLLIAALRAWSAEGPQGVVSSVSTGGGALLLLSAGLGLSAEWLVLVGTHLVLSLSVISLAWRQCQYLDLGDPRSYWRAIPAGLGILSLAGVPLMSGFPARVAIYWTIFQTQRWLLMLPLMIAEALVVGTCLRAILDVEYAPDRVPANPDQEALKGDDPELGERTGRNSGVLAAVVAWWRPKYEEMMAFLRRAMPARFRSVVDQVLWRRDAAYVVGCGLAMGVVVLGVFSGRVLGSAGQGLGYWFGIPRLPIWAALLLPIVGSVVLYRQQDVILNIVKDWWPLIEQFTSVGWLYRAIEMGLGQIRTLIWSATRVVDGAGYMAWVIVVCLVLLLLVISR